AFVEGSRHRYAPLPDVLNRPIIFLFFFSSRRRHTRSDRDWSSDVCSSDLCARWFARAGLPSPKEILAAARVLYAHRLLKDPGFKIGRASCRERVKVPVVG